MNENRWYIAVLVLECEIEATTSEPLVDLQYFLIRAADDDAATAEAERFGQSAEHTYQNQYGESVQWVFRGIYDLRPVLAEGLSSGVEVYSRLEQRPAADFLSKASASGSSQTKPSP